MSTTDVYRAAEAHANRIERELRKLNAWQTEPPPAEAFESESAFFADTMTIHQWLQFVLLPRVREIIARHGTFPRESSVGTYAIGALDGCDEAADLVETLCEFDRFIEDMHHTGKWKP